MNQTLCNQCYLNVEIVGCNDYKILNETERNHQVKTPSLYYTIVARMEKDREGEDNAFLENAVIVDLEMIPAAAAAATDSFLQLGQELQKRLLVMHIVGQLQLDGCKDRILPV